jgi:hypothetical protein
MWYLALRYFNPILLRASTRRAVRKPRLASGILDEFIVRWILEDSWPTGDAEFGIYPEDFLGFCTGLLQTACPAIGSCEVKMGKNIIGCPLQRFLIGSDSLLIATNPEIGRAQRPKAPGLWHRIET